MACLSIRCCFRSWSEIAAGSSAAGGGAAGFLPNELLRLIGFEEAMGPFVAAAASPAPFREAEALTSACVTALTLVPGSSVAPCPCLRDEEPENERERVRRRPRETGCEGSAAGAAAAGGAAGMPPLSARGAASFLSLPKLRVRRRPFIILKGRSTGPHHLRRAALLCFVSNRAMKGQK